MAALQLWLALLVLARPPAAPAQAGRPAGAATTARPRPPTVAAIALSIRSRAIQDSRCYLMNGGAVESFYISEDTPVGSVIGTLSVNGDPREAEGDITLSLQERGAAVGIARGTKNVTLLRALDREERAGPSNVYVNVRCDRRRTTDPSFIIPVSVRVWDVNDNAPVWAGAPYRARLSELAAPGARVLPHARAADADQPGPHATIHYAVLPGPYSEHFEFPNELDSTLVVKKPLDYEAARNVSVTLRARDAGSPPRHADAQLVVEVLDADDQNPKFAHEHYTAELPEDAEEGTVLETLPEAISARDQDEGINAPLQYSAGGPGARLVAVRPDTGEVVATRALLDAELPVTIVIKATQVDNPDRYALAPLTVRRAAGGAGGAGGTRGPAARGVRFARPAYSAAVPEDTPPGAVIATLHTDPPTQQHQSPLQFYVSERSFLEKFAINSGGDVVLRRPLDYEERDQYRYQVMVTDGVQNDTASLNISVLNVNEWEPRFRYPQYEFRVEETGGAGGAGGGAGLLPVGRLDVHDGDKPDTVALTLRGSDASMFYINDSGEMFLRQEALPALNTSVLHVVATAVDSGAPPRQTSVPVIVHVGPRLLSGRAGGAGGAGRGAVLAVFAAALALLALLVAALLAYIYRVRRRAKSSASPPSKQGSGYVSHDKPRALRSTGGSGPGLPAPGLPALPALPAPSLPAAGAGSTLGASSGSLLSVSAGASTILANSSSSLDLRADTLPAGANGTRSATAGRQSQRFPTKSKVAPLPPGAGGLDPAGGAGSAGNVGGVALMSDHVGSGGCAGGAGRSGVAWPSATIPARVKKLSWDDAAPDTPDHRDKGSGEPALHDATNPALADQLNLTVYF